MRPFFCWVALSCLSSAALAAGNKGYYMQPSIRGGSLVFVSQGDLWKVDLPGGLAHSITSHVAPASSPSISPDGKSVAFTGTYDGSTDVYVMPIDGALPTRLTFDGGMNVVGWNTDGMVIAATGNRSTLPSTQLVAIDAKTRHQSYLPLAQASDGSFDATGKTLYFTRFAFQGSHTKRYQGGTAQSIWKYTEGAAEAAPLTKSYVGTSKDAMWWNRRVYFLSDRDGFMNLWSMDENGGDLTQQTHYTGLDIQSASLDAGKIAYQIGADIHVYDIAAKAEAKLDISLASDFDQSREEWIKSPARYVTSMRLSPDASKVVLTARGRVFVAPTEPGRFIDVTRKEGVRYRTSLFSSDGKSVYALSDQTGETEWWKFSANGVGAPEQVTSDTHVLTTGGTLSPDGKLLAYTDKAQTLWIYDFAEKKKTKVITCPDGDLDDLRWSPDSQWLAYTMPTYTFNRVAIYSVKSGQSTPITSTRSDASKPAWSPDGKWLYFLSDRTFVSSVSSPWGSREPEPYFDNLTKVYQIGLVKGLRSPFQANDELYTPPAEPKAKSSVTVIIDPDGLQNRLWETPIPAGDYTNLFVTDGRIFVHASPHGQEDSLMAIDIKNTDAKLQKLVDSVSAEELSEDGKKILVRRGSGIYVIPSTTGPETALSKPVDLSGWSFSIQPREEWRQIFVEAWRLERDFFYDKNLHHVDWSAVLSKYLPLVERVGDRSELNNLIGQMVGELSALHTFVVGGDLRRPLTSVDSASLGAVLLRDQAAGGYKIARIYQGDADYPDQVAPIARPSVDVSAGDVILQVDGVDTLSVPDVEVLLKNQAGKQVLLHVKDGETGAIRDTIAVPFSGYEEGDLRYSDWESSRRKMVDTDGKGQIGYVHLRAMGSGDIAQWERDFYPVFDRQGLIIDVRHNNGGNIDSWILEKLIRKAWFYWQPRVGNQTWNMPFAFRGHVVVLCDESTASDGEAFTEGIKRLGIGKVIGTRTWGGEVWLSFDNTLVDNGIASAAETGVYGPEGRWLIEGHGVDPDIVVDNLPHATFEGKDAQLEAAIAYLQKEIQEHPVVTTPTPAYPDKSFPRKGGQ